MLNDRNAKSVGEGSLATSDGTDTMRFFLPGMPYTSTVLENEAIYNQIYPRARMRERHPLAQFLVTQESAVAQDFLEGHLLLEDFRSFLAVSEAHLEWLQDGLAVEMETLSGDAFDWLADFARRRASIEIEEESLLLVLLGAKPRVKDTARHTLLQFATDVLGTTLCGVDRQTEKLPSEFRDLVAWVEVQTLSIAAGLLAARRRLSTAIEHNLAAQDLELGEIAALIEAELPFDCGYPVYSSALDPHIWLPEWVEGEEGEEEDVDVDDDHLSFR